VSDPAPRLRSFGVIYPLLWSSKVIREFCMTVRQKMQNILKQPRPQQVFLQVLEGGRKISAQYYPDPLFSHMALRASLLRELVNPNLSAGNRAKVCCDLAREFENRGEYEEAAEVLSAFWPRIGERPHLGGLERSIAAEVLLRAGVLTGIIGSSRQITDAQETAKNLISESLNIFESLRYKNKGAETQTELALCYWRTGDYNNAVDVLKLALGQLTTDSELKAKAIIRKAIVDIDSDRLPEALQSLSDNAALPQKISNYTLKGSYHQTLGDVFYYLWKSAAPGDYLDRALVEYSAASYHFELAEHKRYRANVENNLGVINLEINRCKEAHAHLDRARRMFASLKDKGGMAQVDETRARVLLKEKRYDDAEKVARASVRTLEKSDTQLPLVESLTTHGTALARLGNYGAALSSFRHAIDASLEIGCLSRAGQTALTVFQEMGDRLAVQAKGSLVSGRTLSEEIRSVEHDLIKHALETNEGSVTRAAKNLGISYQELHYMLNTRHKDLLKTRTAVRRRPRKD
jgi:tetratricopeptide (TPR) repeat protein